MAADIQKLADRASRMKQSHPDWGYPLAARKAVEAEGIRYKPDVTRLARDIVTELGRRRVASRKTSHA